MIRKLESSAFSLATEVIRTSFATVANDLGITEENCPKYVGFITTAERLETHREWGWFQYGFYENEQLAGYISISKENSGAFELHNLSVLPHLRHKGFGKQLLDYSLEKIKEMGGKKVEISIVEENTVLKEWYTAYGFIHTGTKKYDHLPFTSGYMEIAIDAKEV